MLVFSATHLYCQLKASLARMAWNCLSFNFAVAVVGCLGAEPSGDVPGTTEEAVQAQAAAHLANDCVSLPTSFASYQEAINRVREARFQFEDRAYTPTSSWVQGTEYFSCDGIIGYLILHTDKQAYIHQGVPHAVWEDFKRAESAGGFYNQNIKGRYRLSLAVS